MLLTMKLGAEAIRTLAYVTAAQIDLKECSSRIGLMTPIIKGWGTEFSQQLVQLSVQIHGGMGFIEETGVAQYMRDVRITTIYEGTSAIQASNTSYLDLDEIAAETKRPQDVIGMHFFSPANVMRLLEIVRGEKTAKGVVATVMELAKTLGKVGVVVGVCFGFVGNRMLAQRQREAEKLILEGAWPWDVDRVLYDFGFPMGPFQMRDLAGVDVGWDPEKSSSTTVREILNEMGRRGQKTGAGFYDYDDNRKSTPSKVVEKVILDFCISKGIERRSVSDREILERCLYSMINEGANILADGMVARASDIDIVWINGYGWPAYRGGPMFWAGIEGLDKILARLKEMHQEYGDDFRPSSLLENLVAQDKSFKDI